MTQEKIQMSADVVGTTIDGLLAEASQLERAARIMRSTASLLQRERARGLSVARHPANPNRQH